jgi:hypothetical protein
MPKIGEELFRELLGLYVEAYQRRGLSSEEEEARQIHLDRRLLEIYSADPLPFPQTFIDFRRFIIDRFLERFKKEDPRYRRPRF